MRLGDAAARAGFGRRPAAPLLQSDGGRRAMNGEPLLRARGLTKRFPVGGSLVSRRRSWLSAVEGVDLEIGRGEAFGLVGESGSGKSTLARLLVRLIRPTSGEIVFDGIDFGRADRTQSRELYRKIQIVFQDPQSSLD